MNFALAILVLASILTGATAAADNTITLIVHPPEGTPADATLYVAGNHSSVGSWEPNKHSLKLAHDGTWQTRFVLPDGFELQYKLTLGGWGTVEKAADGGDIANRTATIADGQVLDIRVDAWGLGEDSAKRPKLEPSLTGNVQRIEGFRSEILGNNRDIFVYLPPSYDREPDRRFPVLYMQDGQNLFDRAAAAFGVEWEADETAERLIRSGAVEPLIIVGITTQANRIDELSDTYSERFGGGGKAALYGRFLVEELKPMIDKKFRTKPDRAHTGVGGSSLGGYVSLLLLEQYPEVFSRVAAVSPAVLWNDGALARRWAEHAAKLPLKRTRFWIDVGTRSGSATAGRYLSRRRARRGRRAQVGRPRRGLGLPVRSCPRRRAQRDCLARPFSRHLGVSLPGEVVVGPKIVIGAACLFISDRCRQYVLSLRLPTGSVLVFAHAGTSLE